MIRPFFSIVISCYNSKKTIGRLLQSIVDQHMLKSEIEVIISDDQSTQDYQQEIQPFINKLLIKQIKTDYNICCPGNTRQKGSQYVTGQWLIFSDHDDYFIPNSFNSIKKEIKQLQKQNFKIGVFMASFNHANSNNQVFEIISSAKINGWTHGKFFNVDNFWRRYNVHYIKDLLSHEDVAINSQMACISIEHPEIKIYNSNIITYTWVHREESLSNRKYYYQNEQFDRPFLDVFFTDYLDATIGVFIQKYKEVQNNTKNILFYKQGMFDSLLLGYFYTQHNIFYTEKYLIKNYECCTNYLLQTLNFFNIQPKDIYNFYIKEHPQTYAQIMQSSLVGTGYIPYLQTLKEWLEIVYYRKY